MKRVPNKISSSIFVIATFIIYSLPVLSNDGIKEIGQDSHEAIIKSGGEESSLDVARVNLGYAFDAYEKGDIDSAKHNLNKAIEWLHKAAQNSNTEKVRYEAHSLAAKIEKFQIELSHASEEKENDLARFWHQATSIIKREADQLVHGYLELSNTETTLKHLLDAKMHIFTAEYDLFVSHDAEDASEELDKAVKYLNEASQLSKPAIQNKVILLRNDIQLLKKNTDTTQEAWVNEIEINALNKALNNLVDVNENISPTFKLRIERIKADIITLRDDVARSNLKYKYESAMESLRKIIAEL